jgi:hypothetical protein
MPTTIINKIGKGAPSASKLIVGEIAQDEETGSLYVKRLDGTVVEVSGNGGGDGNQNIDGGNAGSIYLLDQIIEGGSA